MEAQKKPYFPAIDGLRCYSAFGIVIMHTWANTAYSFGGFVFDRVLPSLTNLVFLFMMISSFGLCCGYYDRLTQGSLSMEHFYNKRFTKIWPFFAFMCLLELCLSPSIGSLYEAFSNLTMFFGFIDKPMSIIGVGWFIGVVFIFYLIFPFFCYLLSDKKRAWLAFLAALLLNLVCKSYFSLSRTNFAYCFVYFLAGGLLFIYKDKLSALAQKYRYWVLLLCVAGIVLYYILGFSTILSLMLYSLFLIYALGPSRRLLDNKLTHFLGNISFEIYLCHMAVFGVIKRLKLTMLLGDGILSYIVTCILTLAGSVLAAVVINTLLRYLQKAVRALRAKLPHRAE